MIKNLFSLKTLIWICAIGLATFSGYYSVFGISKLFSGGSWSVVGMAAMLEFSKLVVITFLHDYFKTLRTSFKIYLTSAASVLMIITSIGVYGYLTNSYQETAKSIHEAENKIILLDQKKQIFTEQRNKVDTMIKQKTDRINSYDKLRLSQENVLNSQITQKGSTRGLQKNIQSVDKSTQTLNDEISQLNVKSIGLSDSIAILEQQRVELQNSTYTSELGPLLYLSRITGLSMDLVVNWFIIILVIVFDPLAVSLIVAANHIKHLEPKIEKEEKKKISNNKDDEIVKNIINNQITDAVTSNIPIEKYEPKEEIEYTKTQEIYNKPNENEKSSMLQETKNTLRNFKPSNIKKKIKKNLEISGKTRILEDDEKNILVEMQHDDNIEYHINDDISQESDLPIKENFYGEIEKPGFEYRRGIKL
jgi:hypothetical protein